MPEIFFSCSSKTFCLWPVQYIQKQVLQMQVRLYVLDMRSLNNSPTSDGSPYTVTDKTHILKNLLHHPYFKDYNLDVLLICKIKDVVYL